MLVATPAFLAHGRLANFISHGFTIYNSTIMATTRILLGIICIAVTCSFHLPERHLLTQKDSQRDLLVRIATAEIGVKELTGRNDGIKVEAYLAVTGFKKGNPWCAAFISWVFTTAGFAEPRTAWSPAMFPASRLTKQCSPGNLLGIYFPDLKRIGHVGMIEKLDGDWCISVEGNTNITGSREGDGVYLKRRHRKTIYKMADWVSAVKLLP